MTTPITITNYDIEKINYNIDYAPIGYEQEFKNRIKNDIKKIIENLDVSKTLKSKKQNLTLIQQYIILFLEQENLYNFEDDYASENLYNSKVYDGDSKSFLKWNDKKSKYHKNHRQKIKDILINRFEIYFNENNIFFDEFCISDFESIEI